MAESLYSKGRGASVATTPEGIRRALQQINFLIRKTDQAIAELMASDIGVDHVPVNYSAAEQNIEEHLVGIDAVAHARLHDIDSTDDHNGVAGAVEGNLLAFDADGLPVDSGVSSADATRQTTVNQWGYALGLIGVGGI